MPNQSAWRYCGKCHGMFYDGYPDKGICSAGGGHNATGYTFVLPHGVAGSSTAQNAWRYCGKCHGMFYDGYPNKGVCPAGGGHNAVGYNFVLPHGVVGTATAQTAWRYCGKCHGLFYDGYSNKGICSSGGGHNAVGYNFILPHDVAYEFTAPIVTHGLAALGGRINVAIYPNGALRCWGEATNSGIDSYDYTISAAVKAGSGRMLGVVRSGSVPNRVPIFGNVIRRSWDETFPPDSYVASIFDQFANAQLITNLEYKSDIGGALEAAGGWLLKWGAGTALGPVFSTAVFFGVNVGSLISTGSLVPGARILEGTLWMAGPCNTLFAIAAHGVASLGSQEREIHQDEYDWANKEVFKGSLPPREKLKLTDTLGPGGRAFAFPRFDEKITLNMGPAAFADPRGYSGRYGQTFIHELVHACQIHYSTMDIRLLADAISNRVCEITSGNTHTPYIYGPAGKDFASFNMEQQAQIVSDWFGGTAEPGSNQTGIPKDENSPYFRYIHGNVWVHRYW